MSPARSSTLLLATALAAAVTANSAQADPPVSKRPHQVVLISFDGAKDIDQWQRSRALAAVTGARFTYFLSCVYFLTRETRGLYDPPGKKAGASNVGFAPSTADIGERLAEVWNARSEGHDIGSHACGHFDGKGWSAADWKSEFTSFRSVLRDAYTLNGLEGEPAGWRGFTEQGISGFRAPYLSVSTGLEEALAQEGFHYNASGVSRGPVNPTEEKGVLEFALPQIPEGPNGRRVIAMDYNLFVRHSGGFERTDAGAAFENRSLEAFKAAFDEQYDGARIPLQIGFHFTLMNGGAYWRALERFARDVCLKRDVDCISYADYVARLKPLDATKVSDVGG